MLIALLLVEAACGVVGEWRMGRSSFFDAPVDWKDWFPPGQFGNLYTNACGYKDKKEGVMASNDMFPFPTDAVGSIADFLPDHTGAYRRSHQQVQVAMAVISSREQKTTRIVPFVGALSGMICRLC